LPKKKARVLAVHTAAGNFNKGSFAYPTCEIILPLRAPPHQPIKMNNNEKKIFIFFFFQDEDPVMTNFAYQSHETFACWRLKQ
tara:strand:+ start:187 stop:435 length:249 start_codon:yes stop_codon:yes gene_type:complete